MRKFVYFIVSVIGLGMGFVGAQSISFESQGGSTFGYDCVVPIDVYIDTNGQEISAIDLVMESSMDYVDFVPSDFVPYFLKPIVKENGLIHVVGFTVDPSERLIGKGIMGTLYFSQKQGETDGAINLYFLGEGETSDTNLSIAGGIDVLKDVGQISVKFSKDLPSCGSKNIVNSEIEEGQITGGLESQITGGFANLTYDEVLENTMQTIDKDYGDKSFLQVFRDNFVWVCLILILLIIILLLLKKGKNKGNKNVKKQ